MKTGGKKNPFFAFSWGSSLSLKGAGANGTQLNDSYQRAPPPRSRECRELEAQEAVPELIRPDESLEKSRPRPIPSH